ncbi:uncharacterized protein CEXT_499251 [Caerostris extrusa]|uniref:Uncharacterized protein n=1 Tax=Caerostris extrusa TaxID=172846 RepID=A0AAV4V557_CAEEX|nr:uncharacterized protein CEXT_499251 [Caerostris extrusa]
MGAKTYIRVVVVRVYTSSTTGSLSIKVHNDIKGDIKSHIRIKWFRSQSFSERSFTAKAERCGQLHQTPSYKPIVECANQDLSIHVLFSNFKTKVRVAVLYTKPGLSDDDITNAIDKILHSKNLNYKILLADDYNIDMGTERGREFCKIMDEIYYLTSRNSIAQYTTRARTSIDAVFSTHSLRTCL